VLHHVPAGRASYRYYLARCHAEGRSKAVLTGLAGARIGLSSERAHARRVLSRALSRTLRAEPGGLGQALALVTGLAATGTGYVQGRLLAAMRGLPARRGPGLRARVAR
jgi:hypothetical protein